MFTLPRLSNSKLSSISYCLTYFVSIPEVAKNFKNVAGNSLSENICYSNSNIKNLIEDIFLPYISVKLYLNSF